MMSGGHRAWSTCYAVRLLPRCFAGAVDNHKAQLRVADELLGKRGELLAQANVSLQVQERALGVLRAENAQWKEALQVRVVAAGALQCAALHDGSLTTSLLAAFIVRAAGSRCGGGGGKARGSSGA